MSQHQGLLIDKQRPLICSNCAGNIGLCTRLTIRENMGHTHPLLVQNLANNAATMAFLGFAATTHEANSIYFVATSLDNALDSHLKKRVCAQFERIKLAIGEDFFSSRFAAQTITHEHILHPMRAHPRGKFLTAIILLVARPWIGSNIDKMCNPEWREAAHKSVPPVGRVSHGEQVQTQITPP